MQTVELQGWRAVAKWLSDHGYKTSRSNHDVYGNHFFKYEMEGTGPRRRKMVSIVTSSKVGRGIFKLTILRTTRTQYDGLRAIEGGRGNA